MKSVTLTSKELSRQDDTGMTVAVRRQADGSYRVMLVAVADGSVRSTEAAENRAGVPAAVAELVRWYDKLGGSLMSGRSRTRNNFRVAVVAEQRRCL